MRDEWMQSDAGAEYDEAMAGVTQLDWVQMRIRVPVFLATDPEDAWWEQAFEDREPRG